MYQWFCFLVVWCVRECPHTTLPTVNILSQDFYGFILNIKMIILNWTMLIWTVWISWRNFGHKIWDTVWWQGMWGCSLVAQSIACGPPPLLGVRRLRPEGLLHCQPAWRQSMHVWPYKLTNQNTTSTHTKTHYTHAQSTSLGCVTFKVSINTILWPLHSRCSVPPPCFFKSLVCTHFSCAWHGLHQTVWPSLVAAPAFTEGRGQSEQGAWFIRFRNHLLLIIHTSEY